MNKIFNNESPIIRYWRPCTAWMYSLICLFDFMIAPIIYLFVQAQTGNIIQWAPVTLQASGLFHLAMGAIIGVSAWSRGQEKLSYIENLSRIKNIIHPPAEQPEEPKEENK